MTGATLRETIYLYSRQDSRRFREVRRVLQVSSDSDPGLALNPDVYARLGDTASMILLYNLASGITNRTGESDHPQNFLQFTQSFLRDEIVVEPGIYRRQI